MPRETLPDKVKRTLRESYPIVHVLVWGPGSKTKYQKWYHKRLKVADHLKNQNKSYDVWMSEEIFKKAESDGWNISELEPGSIERVQAKDADLIIALVVHSPEKQPGIYRELQIIAPERDLREKTHIFIPDKPAIKKHFTSGVLGTFRQNNIYPMTWKALEDCNQIRRQCSHLAHEELKQKLYDVMYSRL